MFNISFQKEWFENNQGLEQTYEKKHQKLIQFTLYLRESNFANFTGEWGFAITNNYFKNKKKRRRTDGEMATENFHFVFSCMRMVSAYVVLLLW